MKEMSVKEYLAFMKNSNKSAKNKKRQFKFEYEIKKIDSFNNLEETFSSLDLEWKEELKGLYMEENSFGYIITLSGKNISYNVFERLSIGDKQRYKKAIKEAAKIFILKNRDKLDIETLDFGYMSYISYNPYNRDDDNDSVTIKYIRDTATVYKIIEDDDKSHCKLNRDSIYIKSKEYRILLFICNNPISINSEI